MAASVADYADYCTGAAAPVKNTFIHFADPVAPSGGRLLRRCRTDPEGQDLLPCPPAESANVPPGLPALMELPGKENVPPGARAAPSPPKAPTVPNTPEPSPRSWAAVVAGTPVQSETPSPPVHAAGTPPEAPPVLLSPTWDMWDSAVVPPFPAAQRPTAARADPACAVPPAIRLQAPAGILSFCFTLRRAELGAELGLDIRSGGEGRFLVVQRVLPGGMVDAWNRSCSQGSKRGQKVSAGDTLVSVNGAADCYGMLFALRSDLLLKMVVARRDPDYERRMAWACRDLRHDQDLERRFLSADLLESLQRPSSAFVDFPVHAKHNRPAWPVA